MEDGKSLTQQRAQSHSALKRKRQPGSSSTTKFNKACKVVDLAQTSEDEKTALPRPHKQALKLKQKDQCPKDSHERQTDQARLPFPLPAGCGYHPQAAADITADVRIKETAVGNVELASVSQGTHPAIDHGDHAACHHSFYHNSADPGGTSAVGRKTPDAQVTVDDTNRNPKQDTWEQSKTDKNSAIKAEIDSRALTPNNQYDTSNSRPPGVNTKFAFPRSPASLPLSRKMDLTREFAQTFDLEIHHAYQRLLIREWNIDWAALVFLEETSGRTCVAEETDSGIKATEEDRKRDERHAERS